MLINIKLYVKLFVQYLKAWLMSINEGTFFVTMPYGINYFLGVTVHSEPKYFLIIEKCCLENIFKRHSSTNCNSIFVIITTI